MLIVLQEPHFFYYMVGPAVIFTLDKLVSFSRTTLSLTIIKAELLPSGMNMSFTAVGPIDSEIDVLLTKAMTH